MRRATELQKIAFDWINRLPPEKTFSPADIYRYLIGEHAEEVHAAKTKAKEPRHTYDARWAIMTAKETGLAAQIRRGLWRRTQKNLGDAGLSLDEGL